MLKSFAKKPLDCSESLSRKSLNFAFDPFSVPLFLHLDLINFANRQSSERCWVIFIISFECNGIEQTINSSDSRGSASALVLIVDESSQVGQALSVCKINTCKRDRVDGYVTAAKVRRFNQGTEITDTQVSAPVEAVNVISTTQVMGAA